MEDVKVYLDVNLLNQFAIFLEIGVYTLIGSNRLFPRAFEKRGFG